MGAYGVTRSGFWSSLLGLPRSQREAQEVTARAEELLDKVGLLDKKMEYAVNLAYGEPVSYTHLDVYKRQILVFAALLMIGLQIMIHKTRIGKAMRASSQDLEASYLMGINVNRVISFTFAIGSALAAAGGVMVGIYYNAVWPYMGMMAGLKAFAAAVMGGIGSIPGAMIGGDVYKRQVLRPVIPSP